MITIDEVFNHADFPKKHKDYLNSAYIVDDEVRIDFVNSDNQLMYRYFYFDKRRNLKQIAPEHLIYGARFK